jgi:uncharacterized protein (DUF2267 family)
MKESGLTIMTAIRELDEAVHSAEEWIDDLMQRLGWRDPQKVYLAFVATMHALRDSLPAQEAAFLGDYLPVLLRGAYYEGWRLPKYSSFRSQDVFLERIGEGMHRDPGVDAEEVAKTVLAQIAGRLPAAELEDVKAVTPKALRAFWPA